MQSKDCKTLQRKVDLKTLSEDGTFEGFAAVYGNTDLGGDIIKPGAFHKTLQERSNRKWPVLDEHKVRIGAAGLEDDPFGLKTFARLNIDKPAGRDAYSDLKFYRDEDMQMGMSIGYLPVNGKVSVDASTGIRTLSEVKLFEVTLTMMPMNELARVTQVKSIDGNEDDPEFLGRVTFELKAGRKISKADEARFLAIHNEILSLLREAGIDPSMPTPTEEPQAPKSVEPDYHSLLSVFDKFSLTEGVR